MKDTFQSPPLRECAFDGCERMIPSRFAVCSMHWTELDMIFEDGRCLTCRRPVVGDRTRCPLCADKLDENIAVTSEFRDWAAWIDEGWAAGEPTDDELKDLL